LLSLVLSIFILLCFSAILTTAGRCMLDLELTFAPHIHRLCLDCYYQLTSSAPSLARFLLLLLLSTPLSQLDLATDPHSTLVFLLYA